MEKKESSKIAKAGAGYVVGEYLLKGITFISAPIFTRLLTTEEYGIVGTYSSYEAILSIIIGLALHSSINSAKVTYKENIDKYVSSIVMVELVSDVLWIVLGNVFYFLYAQRIGFSRVIVNVLIIHSAVNAIKQVYTAYISLTYEYKTYLGMSYFNALSSIGISVLLILTVLKQDKVLARVTGTMVPLLLIAIYICIHIFKKSRPRLDREYCSFAIKYSIPIIPHGISQIILNSFDRIMIKEMVGASEAGVYSFAYTISAIVNVAKTSLENIWKPWFFEKMEAKKYEEIRKGATNYTIGMGAFTAMILMITPEIIMILGDRDYWGSSDCVIPVLIGGFFSFLYSIPSIVEYYYKKTKFIAVGTFIAAALNIILNYFFIPQYGRVGAAYTTLFTYFVYFFLHFVLAAKIHGESIFSLKAILCVSIALMGVGAAALALEKIWVIRWGADLLIGILVFVWANKTFSLLDYLKGYINRRKNRY